MDCTSVFFYLTMANIDRIKSYHIKVDIIGVMSKRPCLATSIDIQCIYVDCPKKL